MGKKREFVGIQIESCQLNCLRNVVKNESNKGIDVSMFGYFCVNILAFTFSANRWKQ